MRACATLGWDVFGWATADPGVNYGVRGQQLAAHVTTQQGDQR